MRPEEIQRVIKADIDKTVCVVYVDGKPKSCSHIRSMTKALCVTSRRAIRNAKWLNHSSLLAQ